MSLSRQVGLLLWLTLAFALFGNVAVSLLSARSDAQAQAQHRNSDQTAALARALSQQHGDRLLIDRLLDGQFETGAYHRLRFDTPGPGAPFVRLAEPVAAAAPTWFVHWFGIEPAPVRAQVSAGGRAFGTLELTSSLASVHDELWRSSLRTAAALGAVALLAGLLATLAALRLRGPLATAVRQAHALIDGRFITVPEPRAAELQALTRAMNSLVARLQQVFELQSAQVEQLRLLAHCDPLTGLANRRHFLGQLEAALQREDGTAECGLVLLRLLELEALNRTLGHAATDRILRAIGDALRPYGERVQGCLLGRLNGADFVLCLPAGGVAGETAQALAGALQVVLPGLGQGAGVVIGAVELRRETPLAQALATADEALARAEARGAYQVEIAVELSAPGWGLGERAWRDGIAAALAQGRARLAEFTLIDSAGGLIHLECPLRLQLQADAAFEVAARWLPLAVRARMTSDVDARAVALALEAIARDGQPRCVNLAPASLADSGFAVRLRGLLFAAPRMTRRLWLEVAEVAAVDRPRELQELSRQLRPCGVRLGLEHAGARLGQIERLAELGLDFVKLDLAATRGVGADAQRMGFVRGIVELLHGLALQVYAEGVSDADDAGALWACGIDGITGPWASERHPALGA